MKDRIKKFEILLLRPLQHIFLALAIFFTINKSWFLSVGCIVGLFYVGVIGSGLHPLQSFSDLTKGPLTNPMAKKEENAITGRQLNTLLSYACTKVGILFGICGGIYLFNVYNLKWFLAIVVAIITSGIVATILKVIFRTVYF